VGRGTNPARNTDLRCRGEDLCLRGTSHPTCCEDPRYAKGIVKRNNTFKFRVCSEGQMSGSHATHQTNHHGAAQAQRAPAAVGLRRRARSGVRACRPRRLRGARRAAKQQQHARGARAQAHHANLQAASAAAPRQLHGAGRRARARVLDVLRHTARRHPGRRLYFLGRCGALCMRSSCGLSTVALL